MLRNFLRALTAVVMGNAVYFALLWRYLPPGLRHRAFSVDPGLLLDF